MTLFKIVFFFFHFSFFFIFFDQQMFLAFLCSLIFLDHSQGSKNARMGRVETGVFISCTKQWIVKLQPT